MLNRKKPMDLSYSTLKNVRHKRAPIDIFLLMDIKPFWDSIFGIEHYK